MRTSTTSRVVAAAAVLALAAAGCAGKEDRAQDRAAGSGAGWAAGPETLKIGLIGPLTGPFAVLGISQQNSMQVEVDRINAAGGIGGAKLQVEARDSGLDPGKAVQAAQELSADETVAMIVGPSITGFWNATKGIYAAKKKVNCQPAVAGSTFADQKYAFRSQDPAPVDVDVMLRFLQKQGVRSIGLVYENDDTGKAYDQLFKSRAGGAGMTYAGAQFTRQDDQSHTPYVQKLANADALWISNNVGGIKTLAAIGEARYRGRVASGSGAQNVNFLEGGGAAAEDVYFAAPYYPYATRVPREQWKPGYRQHITAVESKYGVNTGPKTGAKSPKGTAIAADCVFAFEQAANTAKSVDPDKVAEAWAALRTDDKSSPSGNSIEVGADHEMYNANDIHVYQWKRDPKGWYTEEQQVA